MSPEDDMPDERRWCRDCQHLGRDGVCTQSALVAPGVGRYVRGRHVPEYRPGEQPLPSNCRHFVDRLTDSGREVMRKAAG